MWMELNSPGSSELFDVHIFGQLHKIPEISNHILTAQSGVLDHNILIVLFDKLGFEYFIFLTCARLRLVQD